MTIIFLIWSQVSILFIYYLTCQWTGHVTTRCQNFFSFFIANLHILLLFLYQRQFLQSENSAGKFPLTLQSRFAWNVQSTHVSVQNDKYRCIYTHRRQRKQKVRVSSVNPTCHCRLGVKNPFVQKKTIPPIAFRSRLSVNFSEDFLTF